MMIGSGAMTQSSSGSIVLTDTFFLPYDYSSSEKGDYATQFRSNEELPDTSEILSTSTHIA